MKGTNCSFRQMPSLILFITICGIISTSCSFPAAAVNSAAERQSGISYEKGSLSDADEPAIRQLATDACEDFVRFLRRDIDIDRDYSKYVDNEKLNEYLKKRTQYFMIHPGWPQKTTYEITDVSINPDYAIVEGKLTIEEWGKSNSYSGLGESQFCIEKHNGKLVITDWYIPGDETEDEFRPGYKIEKNIGFWDQMTDEP